MLLLWRGGEPAVGASLTAEEEELLRAPPGLGLNTVLCERCLTKSHFSKGLFVTLGIGSQFFDRTDVVATCPKAVLDEEGQVWDMPVRLYLRHPTQ